MARREDQALVLTDDGRIWDTMSELQTSPGEDERYDDIELTSPSGDGNVWAIKWLRRQNRPVWMLVVFLDPRGNATTSYGVAGTVHGVRLAPYDAASSNVALDKLIITPTKVVEL